MLKKIKRAIRVIPFIEPVYRRINALINSVYRKENVAIFHIGRCGSTVVGRMVDAHSKVLWNDEIFERYTRHPHDETRSAFVETTIKKSQKLKTSRVYGFETKYLLHQHLAQQCIDMNIEDYIELLRKLKFTKFIVLHRKNYLKRAISVQVGRKTKSWHSKQAASSPEKITLDVNDAEVPHLSLIEIFQYLDKSLEHLKQILLQDDVLFLNFEDDIMEDPRVAYKKICNFVGVEDESPVIDLRRVNPFKYEEVITNFDEVEALLKNSEYSWMLEDD